MDTTIIFRNKERESQVFVWSHINDAEIDSQ